MEIPSGVVLQNFNLSAHSVIKERHRLVCKTSAGVFVLTETDCDTKRLAFIHDIKEGLIAEGFTALDRYYLSREGLPYSICDGRVYTLTDYYQQNFIDFGNGEDVIRLATLLAEFHRRGVSVASRIQKCGVEYENPHEMAQKAAASLKTYRKRLSTASRTLEFEIIFIRQYPYYMGLLTEWLDYVTRTGCFDALIEPTVCHNNLKPESIVNGARLMFTRFDDCYIGGKVYDLAQFFRRCFKESKESAKTLLSIYTAKNALTRAEISALYAVLLFPEKFLSLCGQYFSKKRTFVPITFMNRITEQIESQTAFREYIEGIRGGL